MLLHGNAAMADMLVVCPKLDVLLANEPENLLLVCLKFTFNPTIGPTICYIENHHWAA